MSLEERVEMHDQWLRSMESNHSQMASSLAELERQLEALTQLVLSLGQNQSVLFSAMARLSSEMEALAAQHRKLEETVERYIRFRGNGQPEN